VPIASPYNWNLKHYYKIERRYWNGLCLAIHLITDAAIQGRATLGEDLNQHFKFWFNNVRLPFYTVADRLGWVLSIATSISKKATGGNFYVPLLFLYARWVSKLSPSKRQTPNTVQITFFRH